MHIFFRDAHFSYNGEVNNITHNSLNTHSWSALWARHVDGLVHHIQPFIFWRDDLEHCCGSDCFSVCYAARWDWQENSTRQDINLPCWCLRWSDQESHLQHLQIHQIQGRVPGESYFCLLYYFPQIKHWIINQWIISLLQDYNIVPCFEERNLTHILIKMSWDMAMDFQAVHELQRYARNALKSTMKITALRVQNIEVGSTCLQSTLTYLVFSSSWRVLRAGMTWCSLSQMFPQWRVLV